MGMDCGYLVLREDFRGLARHRARPNFLTF